MTCPGVVGGPQSGGRAMAGLVMVITLQPSHRPSIPGFCNVLLKYLASTPIKRHEINIGGRGGTKLQKGIDLAAKMVEWSE